MIENKNKTVKNNCKDNFKFNPYNNQYIIGRLTDGYQPDIWNLTHMHNRQLLSNSINNPISTQFFILF